MVRGPRHDQRCKKRVQVPPLGFARRGLKSFRIRTCRTLGFAALETVQIKLGLNGILILVYLIFCNSIDQQ